MADSAPSINDNVIEMLIMIAACKGGSSRSITGTTTTPLYLTLLHSPSLTPTSAVVPYFPYSRQSKQKTHRSAITARMLANLMRVAGVDHVITIDLHATQMQGFFKCPVDNLRAEPLIAKWIRMNIPDWREAVVVSKNPGGTKRVTSLADVLQLSFGIVTTDRRRQHPPGSLHNSAIFEPIGTDGTNEPDTLREEAALVEGFERASTQQDFAQSNHATNGWRPRAYRSVSTTSNSLRNRLSNGGDYTSSPLVNSTRAASIPDDEGDDSHPLQRVTTAPGVSRMHVDDDGYEDSEDDNDTDEVCCHPYVMPKVDHTNTPPLERS